jgi:hypothetical protein
MTTATGVPVLCRNRMDGPTVLASDPKSTHEVIWGGKGSPDGTDVQPVPEEVLRTPAFARAVALGVIEVVQGADNDAVKAALQVQSDAFWKRASQDRDAALASIDTAPDNDMIVVTCIGPGTRPDTRCDEDIPVRAREKDASPPLCTRHAALAGRCVRRGDGPWTLEE